MTDGCWTPWSWILVMSVTIPSCSSQTDIDNYVHKDGLLSLWPSTLIVNQEHKYRTVAVSCTHPAAENKLDRRLMSLLIFRKSLVNETAKSNLVASSNSFGTKISQISPFNTTLKVAGGYKHTLVVEMTKASCYDSQFRYQCLSILIANSSIYRAQDNDTLTTEQETPLPKLQFKPSPRIVVGQQLTLTCKASIGLVTDPVKARWIWEYTDGETWTPVLGNSTFVDRGCFVYSSSVYTTRVPPQVPCRRKFRCYVAKGNKRFVNTAGSYQRAAVGCSDRDADIFAIAVAFLGSVLLIVGVVVLTLSVIVRRRREREEARSANEVYEVDDFENHNRESQPFT